MCIELCVKCMGCSNVIPCIYIYIYVYLVWIDPSLQLRTFYHQTNIDYEIPSVIVTMIMAIASCFRGSTSSPLDK